MAGWLEPPRQTLGKLEMLGVLVIVVFVTVVGVVMMTPKETAPVADNNGIWCEACKTHHYSGVLVDAHNGRYVEPAAYNSAFESEQRRSDPVGYAARQKELEEAERRLLEENKKK
jgi:hypothetical protein